MAHRLQASEYTQCGADHETDRTPLLESLLIPKPPSNDQWVSSDRCHIRRSLRRQKLRSAPLEKRNGLVRAMGTDLPKSRESQLPDRLTEEGDLCPTRFCCGRR